MLNALRIRKQRTAAAEKLCAAIMVRSRAEAFFRQQGVADTIDGRFDLVALHAWIVLDELESRREADAARRLEDVIFIQFDEALRQQGASDIGMGRRMRKFASAFFGRLKAYREAPDEAELAMAILRNVYRGRKQGLEAAHRMARYCQSARLHVAESRLEESVVDFGPPPADGV